jgi:carbon-monoxide dehydrogenase small subunit
MISVAFTLNGLPSRFDVEEHALLVDLLRDTAGLRGTRVSCDQGACGACTVLVDGKPITACMTFAFVADGADVRTIEGLAGADGSLNPLQAAFDTFAVPQCGFCTSGMLMLAEAYELNEKHKPDLVEWMSANICRCSGYLSMQRALQSLTASSAGEK